MNPLIRRAAVLLGLPLAALPPALRPTAGLLRSKRSGSRRSTRRNTTTDRVSTANCVSARSGAPCTTKNTAMP